jgi:hypothetical protein
MRSKQIPISKFQKRHAETLLACGRRMRGQIPDMSFDIREHLGQRTRVRHCAGAYRLPDGLPEGAEVTLEDFQPGYWTVSYNGSRFQVAMPCVGDSGMLPQRKRTVHPGCKLRVRHGVRPEF